MTKAEKKEVTSYAVIPADGFFYDDYGNKIAYEIDDPAFDEPFKVIWSANAWWLDVRKVERLIEAFKQAYTVEQASILAGISRGQWEYFNTIHPKFSGIKERCKEVSRMFAKTTLVTAARKDWKAALALLERAEPEEYGLRRAMGDIPTQQDTMLQQVERSFFNESGEMVLNERMTKYLNEKKYANPERQN